ncbi:MAG: hypothetical protein ACQES9_13125 [Myxococcota bacterium]
MSIFFVIFSFFLNQEKNLIEDFLDKETDPKLKQLQSESSEEKKEKSKNKKSGKVLEKLEQEEKSKKVEIAYFSDLMGRFASPGCQKDSRLTRSLLQLKIMIRRQRVRNREKNRSPLLVLGGGNFIGPDAIGDFIFSNNNLARWGVKLLDSIGLDAVAVGPEDLDTEDGNFDRYVSNGNKLKLKFTATNLVCKKKYKKFCQEQILPYATIVKNGVKFGILVLFSQDQAKYFTNTGGKRFKFAKPEKLYKKYYKVLKKKENVDAVILVSHLDRPPTYPARTLAFLRKQDQMHPDLVFSTSTFTPNHQHNNFIPLLKRKNGASLIGSSLYADSFTLVKLQFKKIGTSWILQQPELKVKTINTKPGNLPLDDARRVKKIKEEFCKKYNHQLGRAEIKGKMEINDFLKYILQVLRYEYRGELSVLDKNTLHQENFPLEGKVTAEKILRSVNSNSVIITARIKGSVLKAKLKSYLGKDSQLMVLGLKKQGTHYYVNERKIKDDQHYKLITTKYIITGGGGYLSGIKKFSQKKNDLRKLLLQWFKKTKSSAKLKDKYIDPKSDFPDFGKNYVLFGATNIGINFGNITTTRSGLYEENSQLAKENLRAVTFDFTLSTGISSLVHTLSFTSRMQYGKTWTQIEGEGGEESVEGEIESADEIKLNLLYQWKHMKKILFNKEWWAPIPFLDGGWTTEFTPSLNEENSRYKLGTIVGGVGLEVWKERLFLKIGAGKREEYGENGFTNRNTLYGGWELINGDLGLKIANMTLKGESRLDAYVIDDHENLNYEFKAFWKIYLAFSERLFFNLKGEYYMYKERGTDWASVFDIQVGVSFQFDSRIPFFI